METTDEKQLKSLCKLFIGGLPRTITDEDLEAYFLQFTPDESLSDCVVIKDPEKQSRGFGFVTFNRLVDTDNCLTNCPHVIGGRQVEVKHAIPRTEQQNVNHARTNKVFVGGLPREATEEDISEAIQNHVLGCGESLNAKVSKVNIVMTKNEDGINPPVSRGFAFVEMATDADADKVVIVKLFKIAGREVELKKAEPKGGLGRGYRGRGGRGSGHFRGGGERWNGVGYNGNPYTDAGFGFSGGYSGYESYDGGYFGHGNEGMFGRYSQQDSGFGPFRGGRPRGGGYSQAPY
ncbi:heterogeneous nuclear ribonucleoprotein A0-like [Dendronephthya gigantea]|uniref:heterogeneous nuclear ribonucleoprotein A0-like n=1 Tax=Dendronephthya gigantea TaxID=151771 RepID=UPI00106C4584|nr:heterogeneous nuclear ribonucleoprotein A0-like [Dendronephthya gigantea]XP_028394564.1 heterogeneous nuclear ribonucleoprotein A0-like [Dendronephthya gigantea]